MDVNTIRVPPRNTPILGTKIAFVTMERPSIILMRRESAPVELLHRRFN